ncbi:uncharacterized protein LOC128555769 [Mercenaria mercenaria]|uniref:uncharacterized protein LOC128555769 n=1 Tax=Mercenaria mercenaria TaxID=6596 RepID=UPI00234F32A9|nr:uncharacterized protein LOC128555769 [Mercenaria mercenaria]
MSKQYGTAHNTASSRHSQRHPIPNQRAQVPDPRVETLRKGLAMNAGGQRHFQHEHPCQRQTQTQDQMQLQRPAEASKQMLYGTFSNLLTTLEEFEERELDRKGMQHRFRRSHISIPDQRHKRYEDVKCNVETQLLLFETQTKACPTKVREALHEELKRRTLGWVAVRAELSIQNIQETDRYIAKLYEILVKGRTDHKEPSGRVTEGAMRETFQAFLYGDHDREMLDRSFRNDRDKKAKAPDTRQGEMLEEGAKRISRAYGNSGLDENLRQDLEMFTNYGPGSLR